MEYMTLNNGVKMPLLGFGTFQIDPIKTEECVLNAIASGYRLIDTAQGYFNEEGVGNAIKKCGVSRSDLFIVTKIWISNAGYENAKLSIEDSLKKLQTNYIDLCLIHHVFNDYYGTYRAMEDVYKEGKIRAIGVSNFSPDRFIDLANCVDIIPAINQVEFHAFFQQKELRPVLERYGTKMMGWAPLSQGKKCLFSNDTLLSIADKYKKTIPQIVLRFIVQNGIATIPKTIHIERLNENISIFDFNLSDDEIKKIETLDVGHSMFIDFCNPKVAEMFTSNQKRR